MNVQDILGVVWVYGVWVFMCIYINGWKILKPKNLHPQIISLGKPGNCRKCVGTPVKDKECAVEIPL